MSDELQHGGEGIPEKKENANAEQSNPKPDRADTPVPVVPTKSNLTPSKSHDCCKKYKRIKEEIKYWFEIFGIVAGIGVLILLWKQYGEMVNATNIAVGQLKVMQKQADTMQGQSYVLTGQWQAMQGQLDEMKRTRELDERAWVVAYDFEPENLGTNRVFRVFYKNTGKTPAVKCRAIVNGDTAFAKIPDQDTNQSDMGVMLLPPNGVGTIDTKTIPFQSLPNIESGLMTLYIFGTVWYDDISGHPHWSQFCIGYSNGKCLSVSIHNSCDDAQANQN